VIRLWVNASQRKVCKKTKTTKQNKPQTTEQSSSNGVTWGPCHKKDPPLTQVQIWNLYLFYISIYCLIFSSTRLKLLPTANFGLLFHIDKKQKQRRRIELDHRFSPKPRILARRPLMGGWVKVTLLSSLLKGKIFL